MNNQSIGIECRNLSFSWNKNPREVDYLFRNVSFNITKGEFVSFIGPSGCGKSTLLNCLSGLKIAQEGRIFKDGVTINEPNKDLGFVFQDYSLFPWLNVYQNVKFGLKINKETSKDKLSQIDNIVKRVGLWQSKGKFPFQLSGGMKQRTAIARVLANGSNYLLMDEPFGALDYQTRLNLQNFLAEICKEFKKTVLFVTHNVEEAVLLSDRIFLVTTNPNSFLKEIIIDLPKERDITSVKFNEYKKTLISNLNIESSL